MAPGTRKRSARPRLTLWVGGPEAVPGVHWWYVQIPDWGDVCACEVAVAVGVKIPASTYEDADPSMSQRTDIFERGHNTTAILPWEEGE